MLKGRLLPIEDGGLMHGAAGIPKRGHEAVKQRETFCICSRRYQPDEVTFFFGHAEVDGDEITVRLFHTHTLSGSRTSETGRDRSSFKSYCLDFSL